VSGLRRDPAVAAVAARAGAALILGHWPARTDVQSIPPPNPAGSAESEARPHPGPLPLGEGTDARSADPLSPWESGRGEGDPVAAVLQGLQQSVSWALAAGCAPDQLAVDPGLGFAKPPRVSLALLRGLGALRALGLPVA